jgi:hypothetical protein
VVSSNLKFDLQRANLGQCILHSRFTLLVFKLALFDVVGPVDRDHGRLTLVDNGAEGLNNVELGKRVPRGGQIN